MDNPFLKYQQPNANPFGKYRQSAGEVRSSVPFGPERPQQQDSTSLDPMLDEYARNGTPQMPEEAQRESDILHNLAQQATFNYSDEILAAVKSAWGEDYAKALQQERDAQRGAQERLGGADKAANTGLSMLLPMGPIARGMQALAGTGRGFMGFIRATAPTGAVIGGASALGEMNDKSNPVEDAKTFSKGAAVGGVVAPTMAAAGGVAAKAAGAGAGLIADVANRAREVMNVGNPVPLPSTTRYAVNKIANEAEVGGWRTPQELNAGMAANAVPSTPMAAVNGGNDRMVSLAGEMAANVRNPSAPRMENGREVSTNMLDDLVRAQEMTRSGTPQAEAARNRFLTGHGVIGARRDPVTLEAQHIARAQDGADRLARVVETQNNGTIATTNIPGFVDLMARDPTLRRLYREVSQHKSLPGSPDYLDPNTVPLLPDDYQAAVTAHQQGARAAAPVALTDSNIPATIFKTIRQHASHSSRPDNENLSDSEWGRGAMRALDTLTANLSARSRAGRINAANQDLHQNHLRREDFETGYAMPTQENLPRNAAVAETRGLPQQRQENRRIGMVHGIADELRASPNNIASVPDRVMGDSGKTAAYEEVGRRGGTTGASAPELRGELQNIGNMQDVHDVLQQISRTRTTEPIDEVVPTVARAYTRYQFKPSSAYTAIAQTLFKGQSEARRREILRLLTSTGEPTGPNASEGVRSLAAELQRRVDQRNLPPGLAKLAITAELSKLLGERQATQEMH